MRSSSSNSNKRSISDSLLKLFSCFSVSRDHSSHSRSHSPASISNLPNSATAAQQPSQSSKQNRLRGSVSASSRTPSSVPNATAASTLSKDSSIVAVQSVRKQHSISSKASIINQIPPSIQLTPKQPSSSFSQDKQSNTAADNPTGAPSTSLKSSASVISSTSSHATTPDKSSPSNDTLAKDASNQPPALVLPSVVATSSPQSPTTPTQDNNPSLNKSTSDQQHTVSDTTAAPISATSPTNITTTTTAAITTTTPPDAVPSTDSNSKTLEIPAEGAIIQQHHQADHESHGPQIYTTDEYDTDAERDEAGVVMGHDVAFNPYLEMVNEDGYLLSSLGPGAALLNPPAPELKGRKCLVLDLDETLVHSSFKSLRHADFIIPVEIDSQYHNVYVIKRPGVDEFMKRVGELYEVVVFTASVSRYGDPLLDQLDIHRVVHHRLFRESCYNHEGNYVKNLSVLGRPLKDTIIIDNSPMSYIFHPQHAVPVSSWFSDTHDNELIDMIPFLEDLARNDRVRDVTLSLDMNVDKEADKEEGQFDLAPPFTPNPVANPVVGFFDQ